MTPGAGTAVELRARVHDQRRARIVGGAGDQDFEDSRSGVERLLRRTSKREKAKKTQGQLPAEERTIREEASKTTLTIDLHVIPVAGARIESASGVGPGVMSTVNAEGSIGTIVVKRNIAGDVTGDCLRERIGTERTGTRL